MKLGDKILELRKKKGLSQEQLGEKIDVTRQTISNWELGVTQPNPDQLKLLSKELSVSIDELLDNNIQNVLIEKVSNTEKISEQTLTKLRHLIIVIVSIFAVVLLALVLIKIYKKVEDKKYKTREESIYCKIYGEEHSYSIIFQEETGKITTAGGDSYFYDILDLAKYDDANQVFNIINDYVKKNGGSCVRIKDRDLNSVVNMYIKEGTLTKTSATIIIEESVDYDISYGEPFWIEKYNYKTNSYEKLEQRTDANCAFKLPAYSAAPGRPLVLNQNWSCMYGELSKGLYRIVKDADFDIDRPIDETKLFYIWAEFEIE